MKNETGIPDFSGKKILMIRLSSLGDILLATPLIRTLEEKFENVMIDFMVKRQYQSALMHNPHISNLVLYDREKDKVRKLLADLQETGYDAVIDLQNNFRSAEIRKALSSKEYIFNKRTLDKFLLVNFKINRLQDAPGIPERYAMAVPGLRLDEKGLELYTRKAASPAISGIKNLIGVAPGSRHFTKMWPVEYYQKLGIQFSKKGYRLALLGGKGDLTVCTEISEKIPGSINLCNEDDLLQTAADMKNCIAVVCNDSGMMHTACAVGIPVLTFFGSTVREFGFIPYKNRNLILENKSLTCRPCSHIGRERCPKGHFKCMLEITPERAYEALMTLVED